MFAAEPLRSRSPPTFAPGCRSPGTFLVGIEGDPSIIRLSQCQSVPAGWGFGRPGSGGGHMQGHAEERTGHMGSQRGR